MIHRPENLTALVNARVVTPDGIADGLAVMVRDGRIESLVPVDQTGDAEIIDLLGRHLLPGFIDTQVNGGGGVLFNDAPTVETVEALARAHATFGTTALLPTLVSDTLDVIERGLAAVDAAIVSGVPGVLGIHIEGPFINEERRGVHSAEKLQALTDGALERLAPLAHGPTLITLAPEQVAPGRVAALVEKGFIVSAGHSAATFTDVEVAISEGLSGFTHLYNAMSPLTGREPGMVGAGLVHDSTWCGVIVDRVHVADASIDVALRCKGPDRLMLVTDAMPPVGTDLESFELLGQPITVRDGICRDARGALAGSRLDMAAALRNIMAATGCDLAAAARMASTTPAGFLGVARQRGAIAPGRVADFAILDRDLSPVATLIGGRTVWSARSGARTP